MQGRRLPVVFEVFEQVSEPSDGRILVGHGDLGEGSRVRLAAEVVNDLRRAVKSCRLMEVPHGIEQQELNAGDLREPGFGLHLREPIVSITLGERVDSPGKNKPSPTRRDPEEDCASLDVATDGKITGKPLTICLPPREFGLVSKHTPAWSLANRFGLQVLRVNIGRGSVTVIPRYSLISNKNLIKHEHAEIFVTASHLVRGDALYIVNVAQAETLIALVWRLAAPALVFFGLTILCIILRQLPRFGPPLPPPAMVRRSLAEQIRANAAFAWRTRKLTALRAAVRRALDETAKKRIASYSSLDVRKRVNAIAAWAGVDSKALNSAMTEDAVAAPQVQRAAITLLEQTRRILNARIQKINQGRA